MDMDTFLKWGPSSVLALIVINYLVGSQRRNAAVDWSKKHWKWFTWGGCAIALFALVVAFPWVAAALLGIVALAVVGYGALWVTCRVARWLRRRVRAFRASRKKNAEVLRVLEDHGRKIAALEAVLTPQQRVDFQTIYTD